MLPKKTKFSVLQNIVLPSKPLTVEDWDLPQANRDTTERAKIFSSTVTSEQNHQWWVGWGWWLHIV